MKCFVSIGNVDDLKVLLVRRGKQSDNEENCFFLLCHFERDKSVMRPVVYTISQAYETSGGE